MKRFKEYFTEDIKKDLIRMGANIKGNKVTLYRGGNVSKQELKKLRYNDYLSTVKTGTDAEGNAGASDYGKNVIEIDLPIKDLKYTNGEIQYQGKSSSLKGTTYPIEIYKAYNDYYGSNYTSKEIDKMELSHIRSVASQSMSDGRDEFDRLLKR